MRVLITGASGFVGRRLASLLGSRDHLLAGTFIGEAPELELELFEADLADREALANVCSSFGPDRVIHLAGLSHVGASFSDGDRYHEVNAIGTRNVVEAAKRAPVLLASSSEVYGTVPEDELPIREGRAPAPQSPYAESKVAAEAAVLEGGGIVVRCFNVIGPGQATHFALPTFSRQLAEIAAGGHEPVLKVGNLDVWRDFVHLDDAVEGYATVLERGVAGKIYNLATGRARRVGQLLERLIELSGQKVDVQVDPTRVRLGEAVKVLGDASRLRALGWEPRRQIDEALRGLLELASRDLATQTV